MGRESVVGPERVAVAGSSRDLARGIGPRPVAVLGETSPAQLKVVCLAQQVERVQLKEPQNGQGKGMRLSALLRRQN